MKLGVRLNPILVVDGSVCLLTNTVLWSELKIAQRIEHSAYLFVSDCLSPPTFPLFPLTPLCLGALTVPSICPIPSSVATRAFFYLIELAPLSLYLAARGQSGAVLTYCTV